MLVFDPSSIAIIGTCIIIAIQAACCSVLVDFTCSYLAPSLKHRNIDQYLVYPLAMAYYCDLKRAGVTRARLIGQAIHFCGCGKCTAWDATQQRVEARRLSKLQKSAIRTSSNDDKPSKRLNEPLTDATSTPNSSTCVTPVKRMRASHNGATNANNSNTCETPAKRNTESHNDATSTPSKRESSTMDPPAKPLNESHNDANSTPPKR